jgi:hypothetical protein
MKRKRWRYNHTHGTGAKGPAATRIKPTNDGRKVQSCTKLYRSKKRQNKMHAAKRDSAVAIKGIPSKTRSNDGRRGKARPRQCPRRRRPNSRPAVGSHPPGERRTKVRMRVKRKGQGTRESGLPRTAGAGRTVLWWKWRSEEQEMRSGRRDGCARAPRRVPKSVRVMCGASLGRSVSERNPDRWFTSPRVCTAGTYGPPELREW